MCDILQKEDSEANWVAQKDLSVYDRISKEYAFIPVKHHPPYVDDEGIWYPVDEYTPEWADTSYKLLISKDMFIEAYNKWIKGEQ